MKVGSEMLCWVYGVQRRSVPGSNDRLILEQAWALIDVRESLRAIRVGQELETEVMTRPTHTH